MGFQTVRGMRDLIGSDACIQEFIEGNCRKVFASYGYLPQYTPAVENFDLLAAKSAAGEEIKNEIYYFKDKGDRELGLRFDLTVPLGRIASSNQLKMPYKRYAIEEVYRYDRPQAKRYRAFKQADIDILGVKGLEAELEVMLVTRDVFKKLGLSPKVIFNSRKLLEELISNFAKGKEIETMRILDKLDKVGEKDCKAMLVEKEIDANIVDIIVKNDLEEITQIVGQSSNGLAEVKEFSEMCKENKLDFVEYNAALARGLEYYTGIVFEIKVDNGPSVGGGGRFDKLVGNYDGQDTPAVGISYGVSRLFDILKEKGFKTATEGLFLIGIKVNPSEIVKIGDTLRQEGIFVEVDLAGKNISKGMDFAEKKGYTYIGIIGEDEIKENKITIKNLKTGSQETLEQKVANIKEFLKN
ncbi:MAG: histidine--tRNA ligase [Candidatus Diapherotrites archaeon]|jgi:histidyl-tRNA synthetase|uniref:Histidine--tRNA ligase n=1 Tax=Candidatus Iainarchaeum sp. TaxID=3101447 RepID=A0A8T5GF01_9ARCH|nr:histidine--tRNA ligase [Candidatus Diapherotrites archaeon]MBT7240938.1 histidine--tRNA ligase [Candidatus Diapherotrites archaeon]